MNQESQEIIGQFRLLKNKKIGEGSTGEVFFGYHQKEKYKVAAKLIDINKINHSIEKQITNEIKNLTNLKSPFIVRLYYFCRCDNHLYLFLEYCDDGDLKKYLKLKKVLYESQALLFMRHIIQGYKVLYANKIIHRDIKPANILLKQGIAKLADFGFSRVVSDPKVSQKLTLLGTPLYTAIQILEGQMFSSKCDVWSLGILFYQMLNGHIPWIGEDIHSLKDNIKKRPLEFKETCKNPVIISLIREMLALSSENRISWEKVFAHPLFTTQISSPVKVQQNGSLSIKQTREKFQDYLKNNIVKSYLRFDMNEVNFKKDNELEDKNLKKKISKINSSITHKRNTAFLYAYMLYIYYKNLKLIPKQVNRCMEFEYALIFKAQKDIYNIGKDYFAGNAPLNIPEQDWAQFKSSFDQEELKKLIRSDYDIIERLRKKIKKEAQSLYKQNVISQETPTYFNGFQSNFQGTFKKVLEMNGKVLKSSGNNGVCKLLAEYVFNYALKPEELEKNIHLDFGAFYEQKERMYGLSC